MHRAIKTYLKNVILSAPPDMRCQGRTTPSHLPAQPGGVVQSPVFFPGGVFQESDMGFLDDL